MSAADLRKRITKKLVDDIEQVQFPSVAMLDRVESTLRDRDSMADYAETLIEKVEATRFPSPTLLNRLDAVLARLEQAEQQEQERRAA
jgi:hypothetical protein